MNPLAIHLKHQVLFSLKNNEEIFMNVVCCSRDWRFKAWNSLKLMPFNVILNTKKAVYNVIHALLQARKTKNTQIIRILSGKHSRTLSKAV